MVGAEPAGAISSNLEDLSRWVIALLNALPNADLEAFGWSELLNSVYGTGRMTASYRGHLLSFHSGDLSGFHSQVSIMPRDGTYSAAPIGLDAWVYPRERFVSTRKRVPVTIPCLRARSTRFWVGADSRAVRGNRPAVQGKRPAALLKRSAVLLKAGIV
ncbi:MAG: hypothetical protein ACJ76Y_09320, partial [Thermoanaerobaculia bacterium]